MQHAAMKLKIQLMVGDCVAIGPGKADLLEAIRDKGSISAAARSMGMSYRRAWLLVDEMNRCFDQRLVDTLVGGGRDRGARLTALGSAMLDQYRALAAAGTNLADTEAFGHLAAHLRDTPASS